MPKSKGHLNPGDRELGFDRFELGPSTRAVVRHVWVVRWNVPAGEVRPQRVLGYPAFNVVFEPGAVALYRPDTRVQVQALRGASWAVGVLLRPAAGPLLTGGRPASAVSTREALPEAPLAAVERAMSSGGDERATLGAILRGWLGPLDAEVDDHGRLVNEACRLAEEDDALLRAADLAARLHVSPRSLERRVRAHVGVTPKWLIECRRLQHAATTLYAQPDTELSDLAVGLGYADYAHFSRQYRAVLGETPRRTREAGVAARVAAAKVGPAAARRAAR